MRFVVADVSSRDQFGLLERVHARSSDSDGDPVADLQLARRNEGGDAASPEDEDRAVAVAERLVERLAEHLSESEPVAALNVDRDLAACGGAVERADEEPQWLACVARRRTTICHAE